MKFELIRFKKSHLLIRKAMLSSVGINFVYIFVANYVPFIVAQISGGLFLAYALFMIVAKSKDTLGSIIFNEESIRLDFVDRSLRVSIDEIIQLHIVTYRGAPVGLSLASSSGDMNSVKYVDKGIPIEEFFVLESRLQGLRLFTLAERWQARNPKIKVSKSYKIY